MSSCTKETSTINSTSIPKTFAVDLDIPDNKVDKSALHFNKKNSLWTLDGQLYDGFAIVFYRDSIPAEKIAFLNGRKQNAAIQWYPNGHKKEIAHFHKGKLHGVKKRWTPAPDHILISELKYHLGKLNGEQNLWYDSGEPYKKLQMNMGKEEGLQQAYRKNGVLYANYEAREGRTFGLKKSALCFGLDDETIQYEN